MNSDTFLKVIEIMRERRYFWERRRAVLADIESNRRLTLSIHFGYWVSICMQRRDDIVMQFADDDDYQQFADEDDYHQDDDDDSNDDDHQQFADDDDYQDDSSDYDFC